MKTMKKSTNILLLLLLVALSATFSPVNSQNKYIDKSGKIVFEASEELFEPVKAANESTTVIFDASTNQIASLALIKGFRFKNSLMEEHFNENYVESETYPKATFKGNVLDFDFSELSEETMEVMVDGTLKLNGKEKQILTSMNFVKVNDLLIIQGSFSVSPADFGIEIPSIVKNKIAKDVIVTLDFKLSQK
jgi:hypothetical protein